MPRTARRAPIDAAPDAPAPEASIRAVSGITQYTQLASVLRWRIERGELAPGEQLPTVADLADRYLLARITVRQAYAVLAAEGLVVSQRGRGTFVTGPKPGHSARLRTAINDPGSHDLRIDILEQAAGVDLPADLARGAPTYPHYTYLRKLHVQDAEPFCLVAIYVASEIHARFPPGSERHSKIAWLINAHAAARMGHVQQTMTVAPADLPLVQLLGCAFATPVAHMTRWIYDRDGRVAFAGHFAYRGDRFVADVEFPFDMWLRYPGMVMPEVKADPAARRATAQTGTGASRTPPRKARRGA